MTRFDGFYSREIQVSDSAVAKNKCRFCKLLTERYKVRDSKTVAIKTMQINRMAQLGRGSDIGGVPWRTDRDTVDCRSELEAMIRFSRLQIFLGGLKRIGKIKRKQHAAGATALFY